jgi:hypothetical protein
VVPIDDGVAMLFVLATVPEAIAVREVCDFLATLVVAYHRSIVS